MCILQSHDNLICMCFCPQFEFEANDDNGDPSKHKVWCFMGDKMSLLIVSSCIHLWSWNVYLKLMTCIPTLNRLQSNNQYLESTMWTLDPLHLTDYKATTHLWRVQCELLDPLENEPRKDMVKDCITPGCIFTCDITIHMNK